MDIVVGLVAVAGAVLIALAGFGVVRFTDLYARMHAAAKATALGIALIGLAAALSIDGAWPKVLLAVIVLFITGPASSHFVARAAYRAEGVPLRLDGPDDLAPPDEEPESGQLRHDVINELGASDD